MGLIPDIVPDRPVSLHEAEDEEVRMVLKMSVRVGVAMALLLAGYALGATSAPLVDAQQSGTRVFELRTYTTPEGQFDMLNARFRDHTRKIFERHGITNIGYWTPVDTPNMLIYIVAHPSQEEAKKNWAAFRADPEWTKISAETKAKGLTGVKVESKYLLPTDYSAIK
jgi:hypothetical protein